MAVMAATEDTADSLQISKSLMNQLNPLRCLILNKYFAKNMTYFNVDIICYILKIVQ